MTTTATQAQGRKMSYSLATAAALAVLTAAVHILIGTPEIQNPVLGSGFGPSVALELYAAWHLVSVTLVLSAGILVWGALRRDPISATLAASVSAMWLLFAAAFVVVDLVLAGPSGLAAAPQWTILGLVGVVGLVGARRKLELAPIASSESESP